MIHRNSDGKSTASLPRELRTPVNYDEIRLLNEKSVLFVWIDELESEFQHASGLVIARTLAKDRARWGQVVKVHPTSQVPVGSYICPLHVHESFGCVINGLEHWLTYDEHVDCYSLDKSVTETYTGDVEKLKLANPEKEMNHA